MLSKYLQVKIRILDVFTKPKKSLLIGYSQIVDRVLFVFSSFFFLTFFFLSIFQHFHIYNIQTDRSEQECRPRSDAASESTLFVAHPVIFGHMITHCSLETAKRVIGKQCRPRSDASECCV